MRVLPTVVAASFLAPAATAQIHAVSRMSHIISDYDWWDEFGSGGSHSNETLTEWRTQYSHYGSASEDLRISLGSISTNVQVGGSSDYNMMQHSGYSYSSSYTGEFIFDLRQDCTYTLAGILNCAYGNARVRLFDVDSGDTLFNQNSQPLTFLPYTTSGSLSAGRYRLLVEGEGVPVGGGGPGDSLPSATLTIVPAPATLAALLLPLAAARRRESGRR